MMFDYDLFVIGAGSGGLAASKRAASYGAKVAIAEADLVGGTCVIRGCVPKKMLVYGSEFSHRYQDAVGYGWSNVSPQLDWSQLMTAVDQEVHRLNRLHISLLDKAGVELIQAHACLVDSHRIVVGEREVTAAKILLAVGGKPQKPAIPGIEHALTSNDMFHLKTLPERIAILGGGYIGSEFACIMNGLGAKVTQIFRRDQILRGFDQDIRSEVQAGMGHHGIQMLANSVINNIESSDTGLSLQLDGPEPPTLEVDAILCATGRIPNLETLGLDQAGVALTTKPLPPTAVQGDTDNSQAETEGMPYVPGAAIAVDKFSCTNIPHIFAVGDCTDRINLTPVAIAEGRAFADTEFGNLPREMSHDCVPSAVFTQPEAATVGLTEAEARAQLGDEVQCYRSRFRPLFHSLTGRDEKTMIKLVVDGNTDQVLGAHMVGDHAAEIIQGVAIAVKMGAKKADFDATIGIHPSSAEEFVALR